MDPKTTLIFAKSPADYDAFGEMCRAYVVWLHQRYSDKPEFVDAVFDFKISKTSCARCR